MGLRDRAPKKSIVRKLFVHAGYGKTGSSAIQSWFANNVETLHRSDVSYRVNDTASLNYMVSTGNGGVLRSHLEGHLDASAAYGHYFDHEHRTTVISSEVLGLTPVGIDRLKLFCDRYDLELVVVAFVRDAYEWSYSSYVQLVKRHNYLESFEYFLRNEAKLAHVLQARRMEGRIDKLVLLHYDTHKANVIGPLVELLGIGPLQVESLSGRRVNRSLSVEEVFLVQLFVGWRRSFLDDLATNSFSSAISDWLVNTFPTRTSEVLFNDDLHRIFSQRFGESLAIFNAEIGAKHGITLGIGDVAAGHVVAAPAQEANIGLLRDISRYLASRPQLLGGCAAAFAQELSFIDADASAMLRELPSAP